ncbi:tryptophan--tRNA ligase [Thermoactinomyces mirandus]|uniref:Tryptophan--tRNA ligase n=1 Tax=Thermoactinomyces mirandus TaxID=2756294 RepID=A0A7W1XUQ7_9BACL|nr:tryptophan--tRNA ligase [Thermoactinomyces mirandus]MBA4603648.1 tryptophan--tRNA ligase [Thermoactinomyces mirandus]
MNAPNVLTGIKPTGQPHLANYIAAIKPALELAQQPNQQALYFVANYHALISVHDPEVFRNYTNEVAATWLALGLDPDKVIFYRQTDVPEILELYWVLSCFTPKGLMNRAHAYKAIVDKNAEEGLDVDTGVNMGLYTYPILMAVDILLFQTDLVPVGKDQIQHIEIARDIADNFNRTYGETFRLPKYFVKEETAVVPGLDGRKMSKSYGNTIPLFASSKELRKLIMKIKTDSTPPEAPKDPETSTLFTLYREFATPQQVEEMKRKYQTGIGWGQVKQELFEVIDEALREPREKYHAYLEQPEELNRILEQGAKRAREIARKTLQDVRNRIGC